MNHQSKLEQFAVGALTIAALRDVAVRAEVLKVGDPVRVLEKGTDYAAAKVHTGVIVAFEPFKELPTVVIAYLESEYGKVELKTLAYQADNKKFDVIAAAPELNIEVERGKVIDWFNSEERKKIAELEDLKAKRVYFERHFGHLFKQIEGNAEVESK